MNMRTLADDIKQRVKQREDMFLRRLMGMLAKMAKADGKMMIFCMGGRAACPHAAAPVGRDDPIAPPIPQPQFPVIVQSPPAAQFIEKKSSLRVFREAVRIALTETRREEVRLHLP